MVYKYYPIKGIKEGLGPDAQVPIRRDINEWTVSDDPTDKMQVTLFLLALSRFQAVSPNSRDSYFQIAGIHGMPYTSWDEPSLTAQEIHRKGYCVHANSLFPLWHRPYLLLYEQRIYEIMVDEVIPELRLDQEGADKFLNAAKKWRLPFWDWAKNPKMPDLLCWPTIKIGLIRKTIDNPLYKFKMPKGKKMGAYGVGTLKSPEYDDSFEYGECIATSRCPTEARREPTSKEWREGFADHNKVNELLNKHKSITEFDYGETAEMVYRLLTYPLDFVSFATTARDATASSASKSKVTNDINIEFIHNNIHYWVGGDGGHMSQIPVATFDPVFWLHHCNLDRLFAIWQTLNPKEWFKVDKTRPFDQKVIGMGNLVTSKTPFRPFHKDEKGTVWTADDARDWFKLGYTYPELQPWTDSKDPKAKLLGDISEKYGVSRKMTLKMAVPGNELFGVAKNKENGASVMDYAISIKYSKFAMGGDPFNVEVYLGPNKKDEEKIPAEDFITSIYNFSQPAEQDGETVCSNCSEQEKQDVQVSAYIPLTMFLVEKIKQQQLQDLESATVEKLLKRICYRVTRAGNTVPEEKWKQNMNLKVDVSVTEMDYSNDASAPPKFENPDKIPSLGIGGDDAEGPAPIPQVPL
ncbi:hypothetical protein G7Y89_g11919 [Cudoniella acicularis]|uniref:tyrosinase n=1 Tax=Cudoniella acicularis TaxID=354080 RepID=A0A8H4RCD7_9HELO|nr:hypothetical protein G7Y89_g11919 [Cudoniella acicularis]